MDFCFPTKRIHSPTNDYEVITTMTPDQPPARKKVIPDEMFTNKMAAMSLVHNNNNNNDNNSSSTENHSSNKSTNNEHVIRVDDIDAFLADDEQEEDDDEDTYIGPSGELVDIHLGELTLPFERISGSTCLRIPDFVLHPDYPSDRAIYELALQQQQSLQQNNSMDSQYQPMDLD